MQGGRALCRSESTCAACPSGHLVAAAVILSPAGAVAGSESEIRCQQPPSAPRRLARSPSAATHHPARRRGDNYWELAPGPTPPSRTRNRKGKAVELRCEPAVPDVEFIGQQRTEEGGPGHCTRDSNGHLQLARKWGSEFLGPWSGYSSSACAALPNMIRYKLIRYPYV